MPESTQVQIVDFMRDAFNAGEAKSIAKLRSRGYTVTKGVDLLAVEFGFKGHERGDNLEKTLEKARQL
jgi:hypothetical protein